MSNAAAFAGTYSDLKLVKSRSVAQVVVEIPIEKAEGFIAAFGMPIPGAERPVALALLNLPTDKPEQPKAVPAGGKRRFEELPRSQQAALMCDRADFQRWLHCENAAEAADTIRRTCEVDSRAKFDGDPFAANKWDAMLHTFNQATGRIAEVRG